jgi:hypothetical protein
MTGTNSILGGALGTVSLTARHGLWRDCHACVALLSHNHVPVAKFYVPASNNLCERSIRCVSQHLTYPVQHDAQHPMVSVALVTSRAQSAKTDPPE